MGMMNLKAWSYFAFFALVLCLSMAAANEPVAESKVNYQRLCEPPIKPVLMPLPPGSVTPTGWLRDWAIAARNGITGHLDQRHGVFAEGWKGVPIKNARGSKPDGTGWPLEQCAYWFDGALRLGMVLHDEALIQKIRDRLDPIVDAVNQAKPGVSFIHWKKNFESNGFNSWAQSHLGRALVALYHGTGDQRVLDALVKVYANYPVEMGAVTFKDVTGLCNLEAMLETYSFSGDQRILDRARQAIAQPEVTKDIELWAKGRLTPGHVVILYENIRLPILFYPWSGDPNYRQATISAFQWLDKNHMLPYGVTSGEEYASGIGALRKTESCDVVAMLHTASWVYRVEGCAEWGDRMERAFFNAGPGSISRDFKTMSYYQSPNRLRSDSLPSGQPNHPAGDSTHFTPLACPKVLCCVGNVNRLIPSYILHMWMATRDNGLAATLYGPCRVSALAGRGVPVKLTTTTNYPFDETIRFTIDPEKNVAFPLHLRIPRWCARATITVNGKAVQLNPDDKGFVPIKRTWRKGDVVTLTLPMEPRVVRGMETEYPMENREYLKFRSDIIFQPRRFPYASILYGPLLFALPIPDVDPNTPVNDAKWQYALDIDPRCINKDIVVHRIAMPRHWNWPLDAPIKLAAPMRAFDWKPTDDQALPTQPVTTKGKSEIVHLVPYGCAKFRVSMFPVTSCTNRIPIVNLDD